MSTEVKITSTYADRESVVWFQVDSPVNLIDVEVATWWDEVVFPLTGDGGGGDAVYEATVMASDLPELVGQTVEWMG